MTRKIIAALTAAVALSLLSVIPALAATIPPGTPAKAVIHERNTFDAPTWYKLQSADPFSGRFGYEPLGNGLVSHVRWTSVSSTTVNGTGQWDDGYMGNCQNGPVTIALHGTGYEYTSISVTLIENWTTYTGGHFACPPFGYGAHHSTAHVHLATNDPTLNLVRF
jgi:hypothetical protein